MKQVLNLTIFVAFVAISFAAICFGNVEPNRNCYNWEGCTTWFNETRGRCESVCEKSDKFKNATMDCTKPCLSNGFCRGFRSVKNSCLCEGQCKDLPYCMSFMYEDCEKWDDPCKCVIVDPWAVVDVTATTKKKSLLRGILLEQEKD